MTVTPFPGADRAESNDSAATSHNDVDTTDAGYRAPVACIAADITYRQLDYWARTALVEPSLRGANGSGSQRLYTLRDIVLLTTVKRLLDCGISLQNVRATLAELRDRDIEYLTGPLVLVSDGAGVQTFRTVMDAEELLQSGAALYVVALAPIASRVQSRLHEMGAASERPAS